MASEALAGRFFASRVSPAPTTLSPLVTQASSVLFYGHHNNDNCIWNISTTKSWFRVITIMTNIVVLKIPFTTGPSDDDGYLDDVSLSYLGFRVDTPSLTVTESPFFGLNLRFCGLNLRCVHLAALLPLKHMNGLLQAFISRGKISGVRCLRFGAWATSSLILSSATSLCSSWTTQTRLRASARRRDLSIRTKTMSFLFTITRAIWCVQCCCDGQN
jgi:hypothetical protein